VRRPGKFLGRFFRAQAPPIALTLGTGMRHGAEFFHAAVAACGMLGRRGILLTRHAQQLPTPLPHAVRHMAFAPFEELLPLCAAVVTMAASARRHGHWPQARRSCSCLWRGPSGQRGARAQARRGQLARSTAPERRAVGGSAGRAAETRGPGAIPCAERANRRRRCTRARGRLVGGASPAVRAEARRLDCDRLSCPNARRPGRMQAIKGRKRLGRMTPWRGRFSACASSYQATPNCRSERSLPGRLCS